ncbi:MAG: ABC transporter permease [Waddliaceae bacterium]
MTARTLLRQARWQRTLHFLRQLLTRWEAALAIGFLTLWCVGIVFAPWIATHDPYAIDLTRSLHPLDASHLFGTDQLGRDIWSRVLYGGRTTFLTIAIAAAMSAPLGLFLGMYAGYMGGMIDVAINRVIDLFFVIPRLILALVFVAILGPGFFNAAFAVALTSWPIYARVARSETLSLRKAEFIQAAELQGIGRWRLLHRYLLPLCISSLLVRLSMDLGGIILSVAAIGFLGLGVQPPMPEWGMMAAHGRTFLLNQWWVSVMPGVAIFSVSLCFNIIGETVRDLLDPKREIPCH